MEQGERRGFTLIELLVVIAIIAILASILFPVFARAREKARSAVCLSNLKQLMLSVEMYLDDYDELFPYQSSDNDVENWWHGRILPYVKNKLIFTCPSDNRDAQDRVAYITVGNKHWPMSYGINGLLYHYTEADANQYNNVVVLADCNEIPCFAFEKVPPPGTHIITDRRYRIFERGGSRFPRHSDGANLAFLDGHVKWYHRTRIYTSDGVPDNHDYGITWQPID